MDAMVKVEPLLITAKLAALELKFAIRKVEQKPALINDKMAVL